MDVDQSPFPPGEVRQLAGDAQLTGFLAGMQSIRLLVTGAVLTKTLQRPAGAIALLLWVPVSICRTPCLN